MKKFCVSLLAIFILALCAESFISPVFAQMDLEQPIVLLTGSDFSGGGASQSGSNFYGRDNANYVYCQENAHLCTMTATFNLEDVSGENLELYIEGRDHDVVAPPCGIEIELNGKTVFSGQNTFAKLWTTRSWSLDSNTLTKGENRLVITNTELKSGAGIPPWFMLTRVAIASDKYKFPSIQIVPSFNVTIPEEARTFPEPLAPGEKPGFEIRGTKGWFWTPEQYEAEVPYLVACKMNFLMNCYLSHFEHQENSLLGNNNWWVPLSDEVKSKWIKVFKKCRDNDVNFCFAVHPQLVSSRPLNLNSPEDIDQYWQHFEWAQKQGVQWFSISLDDVSWGEGGPAQGGKEHAHLVNTILERLRCNDSQAQMVFCPVPYYGDGTEPEHRAYLEALGKDMDKDVYVFWTGDMVVTEKITKKMAKSYRDIVNHRLVIWDNYPVNDSAPTLHLGPVTGREPDLGEVVDGYMSNPLCPQNEVNRLPMLTCGDYAYNPRSYNPDRSIGQAIFMLGENDTQREILKKLVEIYPGMLIDKQPATAYNSAITRFQEALGCGKEEAEKFVEQMENLVLQMKQEFPNEYSSTIRTIEANISNMKELL